MRPSHAFEAMLCSHSVSLLFFNVSQVMVYQPNYSQVFQQTLPLQVMLPQKEVYLMNGLQVTSWYRWSTRVLDITCSSQLCALFISLLRMRSHLGDII